MPNYRRIRKPGGTYFFTVVTYARQPVFQNGEARSGLRRIVEKAQSQHPFYIEAMVLLPEHLHSMWTLPEGDYDYSKRWRIIKGGFTHWFRKKGFDGKIWQSRFWEHTIRDDEDFARHFDYIHYNPVKHALVDNPAKWEFSTFHKYLAKGWYSEEWGSIEPENLKNVQCVGE
jgi:putative transposase